MPEDAHLYDDTWARYCKAEDEYFAFLDAPPPLESNGKRVEANKNERLRRAWTALHDYHEGHPQLSQVQLENLLRENDRHTYLIATPFPKKWVSAQLTLSFGKRATPDLDHELCLRTTRLRDEYLTWLKESGHLNEEENRLCLVRAGFVGPLPCAFCRSSGSRLKRCGRCRNAHYCSEKCQRADWKRHRPECKRCDSETRK